jgi:hypothetical protein
MPAKSLRLIDAIAAHLAGNSRFSQSIDQFQKTDFQATQFNFIQNLSKGFLALKIADFSTRK